MPKAPPDLQTHVLTSRHSATLALASVKLTVIEGPDRGRTLEPLSSPVKIGTSPGSHLRLTDPAVSRVHCDLRLTAEGLRLTDQGSTNGTFIEGVRVLDAWLVTEAPIRIGNTVIQVELGPEQLHVQLSQREQFGEVLGSSVEMRRLYTLMERVAATEVTTLLLGETGVGKELVARAIHEASRRATGPFVTLDCGAIAENLMESELFGHVRGAFSGAVADRQGLFEEAQGGTLFLDEIGELPLSLQPKLLRVLESQEVRPVGSNTFRPVDVRVLAATHRPLAHAVNAGSLREDLYYRLAVVELSLPPLRARKDDIELLAQHFHERVTGTATRLSPELLSTLKSRSWPGNVRELRNFIERSAILGESAEKMARGETDVRAPLSEEAWVPSHLPLKEARLAWTEQFERLYARALLKQTGGNVTRAAQIAGVNRRSLQRLLAALGIKADGV